MFYSITVLQKVTVCCADTKKCSNGSYSLKRMGEQLNSDLYLLMLKHFFIPNLKGDT